MQFSHRLSEYTERERKMIAVSKSRNAKLTNKYTTWVGGN